jgi:hypothetical protein
MKVALICLLLAAVAYGELFTPYRRQRRRIEMLTS